MELETVDTGHKPKIMGHGDKIILVHVIFRKGESVHEHYHSQF